MQVVFVSRNFGLSLCVVSKAFIAEIHAIHTSEMVEEEVAITVWDKKGGMVMRSWNANFGHFVFGFKLMTDFGGRTFEDICN